jgi:hypothetical protein
MSQDATDSWPEAAERYWAVLSGMPGAPDALRIVDLDAGEDRTLGETGGSVSELQGSPEALLEVLCGREPLIDAAFERKVYIRGTFAELSVLTGACFAVADQADDDD